MKWIAAYELLESGRNWSAGAVKELAEDLRLAIEQRDEARAAVVSLLDDIKEVINLSAPEDEWPFLQMALRAYGSYEQYRTT